MLPTRSFITRVAPVALALPLVLGSPDPVRADSCTDRYLRCINNVLMEGTDGIIDELGSIECGATWAGCVLRSFKGS